MITLIKRAVYEIKEFTLSAFLWCSIIVISIFHLYIIYAVLKGIYNLAYLLISKL